jgi:hypothetical protein
MTIPRNLNVSELSRRLSLLEDCLEAAPASLHERPRQAREIIGDTCDALIRQMQALGYNVSNCDGIRTVEAVMYGWLAEAAPDEFTSAEGFGEHANGPDGERVKAQAQRDAAFIAQGGRDPIADALNAEAAKGRRGWRLADIAGYKVIIAAGGPNATGFPLSAPNEAAIQAARNEAAAGDSVAIWAVAMHDRDAGLWRDKLFPALAQRA